MEKEKIIINGLAIAAILFIVTVAVVIGVGQTDNAKEQTTPTSNIKVKTPNLLASKITGSASAEDAEIVLQPHKIVNGELVIDISVNTHGVDLDQYDLKEITELTIGSKTINPISAPKLSGHHNSGELVFAVEEETESYVVTIKGIPSVEQRTFTWN